MNRKIRKVVFSLILLISCNSHEVNQVKVIEDSFLFTVDTLAYQTFSLRPINPADTLNYRKIELVNLNPLLKVQDSFYSFAKFKELSLQAIKEKNLAKTDTLKMFIELINEEKQSKKKLRLSDHLPTKIGRYQLSFKDEKMPVKSIIVGYVSFSDVLINVTNGLAAYVITLSIGEKSGIEKLVLLRKENNSFRVFQEIELVVW